MPIQSISIPARTTPAQGLIVLLHGWGANGRDLESLAPMLNLPEYQFLCGEAPFDHPYVPGGKMWYDLEGEDREGLEASRQQLTDWLNSLEAETGISRDRTFLVGFSQGGAMTLDVGSTMPLAGLVSLSGFLHFTPQPQPSFPPMLLIHGSLDRVVPLRAAYQARDAFKELGAEVRYEEFDMGHEIPPRAIAVVRDFILSQQPTS